MRRRRPGYGHDPGAPLTRIAYLVHQYPPAHVGGTETYTHGLARRAVAAGHDVVVLTYDESPERREADFDPRSREHEGVAIIEFPYNLSIAPSVARYEHDNPFVAARVRDVLTDRKPDVAHVTHAMKLGVGVLDACRTLRVPTVVSLCDYWFLCPRHTLLTWKGENCEGPTRWRACFRCVQDLHGIERTREERQAIRGRRDRTRSAVEAADRVFALSPFLKGMFVANGYDPDRIDVLPHGLETEGLAVPATRRAGPTRFVFVGALQPFKGAHVPVDALRGEPGLAAELVLHGGGGPAAYEAELRTRIADDPRIRLAGRFEPHAFPRILADADYLVVPALWYENEPIVVKAAKHLGIPVLASRIGSLVDVIEDGVDGWTVPPGDVRAWADALRRAVEGSDRWPRRARPQPDMDSHYARVESVYRELASVPVGERP